MTLDNIVHRIRRGISYFLILTLVIAIVGAIWNARWTVLFVSSIALILISIPALVRRKYHVSLPVEFEFGIVLWLYAALFLGFVRGYYTRFWWWDIVLHTGSGIALGIAGFLILYILYEGKKIHAPPITIALFSFTFAVALGAMWEIFEFSMGQLFGLGLQGSLVDTMLDLIVDSGGALLASVLGFVYLKRGSALWFERLIKHFVERNPRLFKKTKTI